MPTRIRVPNFSIDIDFVGAVRGRRPQVPGCQLCLEGRKKEGRERAAHAQFMADKLYWNNISGSPFYMVAPPSVKGCVCNAKFEVHWDTVWLDR